MSSEWKNLAVKGRGKRGGSGGWRRWFKGGENMFRVGREGNGGSETGEGLLVGVSLERSGGCRSWSTDGGELLLAFKLGGTRGKWVFASCWAS